MLICFVMILCAVVITSSRDVSAASEDNQKWVAAWGTAPTEMSITGMSTVGSLVGEVTVRVVLTPTASGEKFRVKFSNSYSDVPLKLKEVTVAKSLGNSKIDTGRINHILVDGQSEITVDPGKTVYSDPVAFPVTAGEPIAISLFIAEYQDVNTMGLSGATTYLKTGQATKVADFDTLYEIFYDEEDMLDIMSKILEGFTGSSTLNLKLAYESIKFVPAIESLDVLTDGSGYSVVVIGDSTVANDFPEYLAHTIYSQNDIKNIGVVGKGMVGNALLVDHLGLGSFINGVSINTRLDRDALNQSGVEYVILKATANDIIYPVSDDILSDYPGIKQPTAQNLIDAYSRIFKRCHDAGVKVIVMGITQWKGNLRDYFSSGAQYIRSEEEFMKDWQMRQLFCPNIALTV